MSKLVTKHQDLDVYRKALDSAMKIFELSKSFPKEEIYSLVNQIRRCGYLDREEAKELFLEYDEVLAMLVSMINSSSKWVFPSGKK